MLALLRDILHTFHTRTTKKRGILMCCVPLLSRWFISHLPMSVLKNEEGLGCSQRIMSLANTNILWCSRAMENTAIIDRCREYPNIPLLGIRGGVVPQNIPSYLSRIFSQDLLWIKTAFGLINSRHLLKPE